MNKENGPDRQEKDKSPNGLEIQKRGRLRLTSWHEIGHSVVARMNGWHVPAISVIAEGNTLGWTKTIPGKVTSMYNLLREKIAICFGGMMAEKKLGHNDHSGCCSDMAQAQNAANILSVNFGGNASQYLEEGRSNANRSVNMISFSDMKSKAEHLMEVEIAA